MKHLTLGLAVTLTLLHFLQARDALPMVMAWALHAWVREADVQRKEAQERAQEAEELADEADIELAKESDWHIASSPFVNPPPIP